MQVQQIVLAQDLENSLQFIDFLPKKTKRFAKYPEHLSSTAKEGYD